MSPKRFYASVRLMGDDRHGRYLFLRRTASSRHFPGEWELPGGKVEPGEDLSSALLREVKEETGLDVVLRSVVGASDGTLDGKNIAYVFLERHFESNSVELSAEHGDSQWLSLDEVLKFKNDIAPHFRDFVVRFCRSRGFEEQPQAEKKKPSRPSVSWIDEQVRRYREVRPIYEHLGTALKRILQEATSQLCPQAIVDARAKEISSFAEKIVWKKYTEPLVEMTDLCGARVVTHLKSEADAVCAFIRQNFLIDEKNSVDTLSRLQSTEFGYRSVHYIIVFGRKPPFRDGHPVPPVPSGEMNDATDGSTSSSSEVPQELMGLKAEIQVRTILQHAWSDIGHDRLYKGSFKVPGAWKRESARIAAVLESADESFGRMVKGLERYRSNFGAYMSPDEVRYEIEIAEVVRKHDNEEAKRLKKPEQVRLVERIAQLAMSLDDWQTVKDTVNSFHGELTTALKCHLGTALCRLPPTSGGDPTEGRKLLLEAAAQDPTDPDCRVHIAEIATTPEERLEFLHGAFVASPTDPEALGAYVRQKILVDRTAGFISLLRPTLEAAIETCRLQVGAGVDVPWALFRIARFQLLMERPWEAIAALARAIRCNHRRPGLS